MKGRRTLIGLKVAHIPVDIHQDLLIRIREVPVRSSERFGPLDTKSWVLQVLCELSQDEKNFVRFPDDMIEDIGEEAYAKAQSATQFSYQSIDRSRHCIFSGHEMPRIEKLGLK
jgi:hypothetical protein